jgi:hypothetical protein
MIVVFKLIKDNLSVFKSKKYLLKTLINSIVLFTKGTKTAIMRPWFF